MRVKNTNAARLLARSESALLRLYFEDNHLKQLYRQGWLKKGRDIPESCCESVADHVFGTALLAIFVCDAYFPSVNQFKVIKMILIHELGEVYDGDRFAKTDAERHERHEAERAAIIELLRDFPQGAEYLTLWEEFERRDTTEAKIASELDKLEMAMQAKIYQLQHGKDLSEFIR